MLKAGLAGGYVMAAQALLDPVQGGVTDFGIADDLVVQTSATRIQELQNVAEAIAVTNNKMDCFRMVLSPVEKWSERITATALKGRRLAWQA